MRDKLCKTFRNVSFKVWNLLIDDSYYGYHQTSPHGIKRGIGLNEETITDVLLLDILRKQPHDVFTVKFSKNYEGQEGADWEWWILSQSGIVGFRFQAKRLHRNHVNGKYEYSYLDYRDKNGKYQVDKLVDQANKKGFVPMYIFYNYWDIDFPFTQYKNRRIPSCCQTRGKQDLGVTICAAKNIQNLIQNLIHLKKKALQDILPHTFPLYCITCCNSPDLTESVKKFIEEYLGVRDFEIYTELPIEVSARLKGEGDESSPVYTSLIFDLEKTSKYAINLKKEIFRQ